MRHRKAGRRLNRTSAHRKAMLGNLAVSLFRHEQIKTTLPKAKELRRVAEPLITLAKTANLANRRAVFARLRQRDIVVKLFDELGPHFADRPGGYLRILKCGHRHGDNAPMAHVQLVGRDLAVAPQGDDAEAADPNAVDANVSEKDAKKEAKAAAKQAKKDAKAAAKEAKKDAPKNAKADAAAS